MFSHCFYISNCVGERNHCFYLLFLFFGSILSLLILSTSLYHLIYIILIYSDNISMIILKKCKYELIASLLMLLITGFILFYKSRIAWYYPAIPALIGYGLIMYSFLSNYYTSNQSFKEYYHPYTSIVLIAVMPMFSIVIKSLKKQIEALSHGLTVKQYTSMFKEKKQMIKQGKKLDTDQLNPITFLQGISNIWSFIIHKRSVSLLNN